MLKKLLRIIFTIIGGLIGYGVSMLIELILTQTGLDMEEAFPGNSMLVFGILLGIIFAYMFFKLTPVIQNRSAKMADSIGEDLQGVSAGDLLADVIGLVVGFLMAFLLSQIYAGITNKYIYTIVTIATYLLLAFLGVVVANKKGKEVIAQLLSGIKEQGGDSSSGQSKFQVGQGGRKKKNAQTPKILDTSVIIDGRIAEIMKTGFLEGPIVIPEFVLVELRHIADSSDNLKRARGRRGLDVLKKIQTDHGIEIYNTESEKGLKDISEVDVKLLKLAQIMNGKVVTNDFNLNKVAAINGVDVLNINDLANTLKPVVIPGEKMEVTPVKEGRDSNQSIAYLDDGTMVVVEDGRKEIGNKCEITVTSVLQTSAGRMIFGRIKV